MATSWYRGQACADKAHQLIIWIKAGSKDAAPAGPDKPVEKKSFFGRLFS